ISQRAILRIGRKFTRDIYGKDLRRVDPKLFDEILREEFSSRRPAAQFPKFIQTKEPALVVTGPLAPEALLAQISSGKTVVVHYSDPGFKKKFDIAAARAVELGLVSQDQLAKHAYFANSSDVGGIEEFYVKLLKGERVAGLRSLNWLKSVSGLAASDPVVWMAKDSVIDAVTKKGVAGRGLAFTDQALKRGSSVDQILYDIERLALAVKLGRGADELALQGLVVFQNGRYLATNHFLESFLANAVLVQQVRKLVAIMA
ncbi:MAG: hypothetical protein HZC17_05675, partial [Candidatus Omnitrophica bacterium]|nr:hypothetical protein [Candidatus Omnitrophota bacterium]